MMTHGSLFSGIGGFDLAAQWMGWDNKFHCEWEEFPRRILEYHFPNSTSYGNIKETDFTIWRGKIDILSGGFPCQPYSNAGKRLGKQDERHLWPEMLRAIREIKPRWVVGENVRGLLNWNGGVVLDEIYADLENEGYEVWTFVLPASGVNAPHRRDRAWIVAYSNGRVEERNRGANDETQKEIWGHEKVDVPRELLSPRNATDTNGIGHRGGNVSPKTDKGQRDEMGSSLGQDRDRIWSQAEGCGATTTNTNSERLERQATQRVHSGQRGQSEVQDDERSWCSSETYEYRWETFPTKSPVCGEHDGIPRKLDSITFPRWRKESIKAYGNAIVPQVAHQIFKAIKRYEQGQR